MRIIKHICFVYMIVLSMLLLSGCGQISDADIRDSDDVHDECFITAATDSEFPDRTDGHEETVNPTVWKSDADSNARYLFEVMTDKTVFSCKEPVSLTTVITNNGEPFDTFYYGYFAGCRLISEQENQTVIIEMETDIPAAVRYDTIAPGQRSEKHMGSHLYATIIDASGTSRITDSDELPEGQYSIEVYYENCYVPEGGTYPDMVCDEYTSVVLADAKIIIQKEID